VVGERFRTLHVRWAACALAGSLLVACAARTHSGDRDDPTDAPECPLLADVAYDPSDPYPFCQRTGSPDLLDFCPPGPSSHGALFWHADRRSSEYCDGSSCNACLCALDCETDSDCPAPTSGTAVAECSYPTGLCLLACDDGQLCPDGMYCAHNLEADRFMCAWITHGDRCPALP